MKKVYAFIKKAHQRKVPILGICGGLQFTIKALGGTITVNPKGRELGNTHITLTSIGMRDRLFKGLSRNFIALSIHRCMAKNLKPEWKLLASSNKCKPQVLAIGDNIRLVQFHPEMSIRGAKKIITMRRDRLIDEGYFKDKNEFRKFLASIKDTSRTGKKIIKNFLTLCV